MAKNVSNIKSKTKLAPFDKYSLYKESVQAPDADVEFLEKTYRELSEKRAATLREDFCGTFALCCEWVKADSQNQAIGLDNDDEPIFYGRDNYLVELMPEQQERVHVQKEDVLSESAMPAADIVCALNFSYFCFKQRSTLKHYFKKVAESLNPGGIFVLDCFGGGKCYEANEEEQNLPIKNLVITGTKIPSIH